MTRKILSFLLAVCILITPLAYGISYTEEYTTTTPMQSEAATAGSSLNYQVFRQTDQNYGNYDPSGGAGCTIQKNGCGIMSIVNAVYHLNGNIISLKDLFTWAYSTGGYGTAGTTRYTIYPALQAAFGAKYGFSVGTMAYGKVSDATFTNHIKNGGTAIVHVYNHFMCIAGYDAASGRYLLIDPAPNWDNRHSSAGGNWMTAAELTGGINSHYLTIDWYCLLSNATASGTKYTATANVAGGSGSVFFYDDVSSAKFTAGTTVFFRPVPASGYKVTSVTVNGSALAVQNGGNPSIYAFTMPSANCTINVGFSTGGAGHANATYTSAASYALPAGIVARTDSARPNSYVGLFTNATTTYSKSTAIVYFSAPAYYYIGNSKAEGFTTQLQAGKMGGNCGAYGSTGTFKVVTFNTSGTAHSVATISISGSDAHKAAITYGRGVTDNTGGGNTSGGNTSSTLYTVTASVASGSGSVHFGNGVTSAQVYAGTVVNYQVTPASGYKATKILVYGTSQTIKNGGGDAVYQFTMEAANATVSVTFTKDTTTLYSLTAKVASGSGSVHFGNGVTSVQAAAGQVVNYQVTPASGWKTSSITVGGTAVTVQNGGVDHVYQLTMPSGACEVSVKFTSTVTATDIVFDNSTTVNWAKGSVLQATTISLGTCPAGDATMVVKTSAAHNDPQFYLDYTKFGTVSASSYKYMIVTAKTSAANKNAKVYLCPGSITGPTEDCAKSWQWTNDGLWHDYIIDLSGLSTWTGNLNQIRFDYFDGDTASGSTLYLRSIRFTTSKPSTPKVTTDKTTYKLGETITVNYSGLGSYLSSAQNMKPFVGLYKKGTSPGSTASYYWALALSSSGTIDFPDQATAGSNLPTTGLAAGEYVMWIAYDAYGTSGSANFNNCKFDSSSASYSIKITEAIYSLTATAGTGGKVHFGDDVTSTVVGPGTIVNYRVTPNTGYKASKITINGVSQTIQNSGAEAVYQFTMPAEDVTVAVTFTKLTYKITVTTPTNGTVTLKDASGNTISSGSSVAYGTKITVTATPSTGYKLSSLKAGSTSLSSGGTFTVSAATTVTATFAKKTYAITITNPTGATITLKDASGNAVASGASVAHGTVLTVTLTPSSGYRIKTVTVGGTSKKTYTTMSTTAVTYSHTVSAATTISGTAGKIFKVSFSQPTGGKVAVTNNADGATISSGAYVDTGTVIKVTATANTGYKLSTLKAGSTSLSSGGTYTVSAATTVAATFAKQTYKITVTTPTNGTITLKDASGNTISSGSSVEYGTVITVTATPSTGYKLSTLKAGSTTLSSGGTFTVSAATTVSATFTQKTYAITITNPTGATITLKDASGNAVSSGTSVAHGTVLTVTLTPSSGYRVKTVTIGGTTKKTYTTMSTTAVTYSHTVSAATTISGTAGKIFKVSFSQVTGGTIAVTNNADGATITSGSFVDTGTVIKVTATASTGYKLSTLKAGSTSLSSGGTYTVSAATTVAATWAKQTYKITVTTPTNGTITLKDASGNTISSGSSVEYGTVITVTATPSTGYKLSTLKAGSTTLSSGGTFTVSAATTVSATFTQKTYAITITNPTGATITLKDASGNAVSSGASVAHGTVLTVTLTPSSGYRVKTVTIGGTTKKTYTTMSTTAVTYSHTVSAATTISGTAGKIFKVSFSQVTGGTIAVTNNADGATITSGSFVDTGTVIKVTVTESTGYDLSTLKAGSTSIENGGTYTVSAATTVSATYVKEKYTVTISASNGTVTLKDASGNAIASGDSVEYGTVITVTATPSTGYKLSTLKAGSTSLSNGGTFTLTAATTVKGTFTKESYTMTITNPTGGTITVTDADGNAVTTGTAVAYKSVLTVTLTPSSGYRVKTITVNGTSKKTNSTISNAAVTYSYTVGAAAFTLSGTCGKIYKVSYSQATGGTIAVTNNADGAAISSGSYVDTGTVIKVTVTESTGYDLSTLKAGSTSISNGDTYTVSAATTVAATYVKEKYTVTISASNGTVTLKDASGNAIASGDSVEYGTVITVTATPSTGYKLSTLKAGSTSLSNGGTFTLTAATTVKGTFTKESYTMTITNPTGGTITVTDADGNAVTTGTAVPYKSVLTVTLTPSSGYRVKTITVNGTSKKTNSTISNAAVTYSYTVGAAAFTLSGTCGKIYKVSYSQATGGTIAVTNNADGAAISSGSYVDTGTVIKVTVTESTGYDLSTLKAGSTSIENGGTYTVSAATTVAATYVKEKYTVTISASNGTVTLKDASGNAIASGDSVEYGTVITVTATPATGYKLSTLKAGSTSLSSGGTFTLTADTTVTGTFAKQSYNVSVGTVTNGTVTLSSTGSISYNTTITVTATPNEGYELDQILVNGTAISGTTFKVTKASEVTATFKKIQCAVSVGTVSNGTVKLSATGNVDYGTTITVTATPATGYKLNKILVNGTAISGTTFTVTEATTVTATFTAIPYNVTIEVASGSGTATFADGTSATTATIGQSVSYTLTPATGYKVSKITVNGTSVSVTNSGATATYTLTMTAEDTAISVTFAKKTYAVSVGDVTNGTVTLSKTGNISYNTTITVTATPNEGYELDQILVNGTAISGTTFKVTKASTVTATFKKIQCAVSVGTVSNGTVTISPTGTVDYGTTITVTATPNSGYELNQILVNGTAITGTTFTVTEAATVTATFNAISYKVTASVTGKGTVKFGSASSTTGTVGQSISYTVTPTTGYKVTSIKVNGTAVTITNATAAATYTLTMPAKATTVAVTFAAISYKVTTSVTGGNGTVTLSDGTTTGTAATDSTVSYTVTPATGYKVATITVNGTSVTVTNDGDTATYTLTMPAKETTIAVTFSNIQYAVSTGSVTNGTIKLSATGNVAHGTTITVTATPATGYKLNQILVNGTAIEGTTFTVTEAATVTATFTKLTYKVSVGTVSNGTVSLSKTGTVDYGTTITVTATPATGYKLDKILVNGNAITSTTFTVTEAATVTATFTAIPYNVTISVAGGSGTAKFSDSTTATTATIGQSVSYTLTPATGYKVSKITVNGTSVSVTNSGATATYTLTMTAEDTAISVTFAKKTYAVSVGDVTNGTVTLSSTGNISYNTTITVTATPATGYELDQILVNGTAISGTTFKVTKASTVTATFKKIQCAVSVGTVSNGTVKLSATGNVDYGTTITVTATPATGYKLNKILVNGTAISGTTFTVTAASEVTATFTKLAYSVSVGTVSNGTVKLSKTGTVDYGTTITVTATPATGYKLNQIRVNGTAISGTTFTVTEAATVTATFTKLTYNVSVGTVSNGTVKLSKTGAVEYGTTITVTATANDGYELNQILVNGTAITGTTFTVTEAATVTATFTKKVVEEPTYTITIVKGGKGTGNVTVVTSAKAGEAITLTATGTVNGSGYACITTKIESSDVTLATTKAVTGAYTGASFTMPSANVTITVNFQILGDINLSGGINGSDATIAKRIVNGLYNATDEQRIVANVAGTTNTTINSSDATILKRYANGTATTLPNGKY